MSKKNNLISIDELNVIALMGYYNSDKKERVERVTEDFLSFLIEAYLLGLGDSQVNIAGNSQVDLAKMNQAIYKEIDGKTFADRVKEHVENEDVEGLQRVLATEYHRDYNQGAYDGASGTGYRTKKWVTMNDERVRDTHDLLEGVEIPVNEEFYTSDGDHALFPGGFEKPENNINCRCVLKYA